MKTESASAEDLAFAAAFERGEIAPGEFHHRDHVRLAWVFLKRSPALDAVGRYSAALRRFATAAGAPDKYHETITWALLFLIRERMARLDESASWAEFAAENPDLMEWPSPALAAYYRPETLAGEMARQVFVLPDRGRSGASGSA